MPAAATSSGPESASNAPDCQFLQALSYNAASSVLNKYESISQIRNIYNSNLYLESAFNVSKYKTGY